MQWKKPFDDKVIQNIQEIAIDLCQEVMNTKLAYLQSDEINLLLVDYENLESQPWFNAEIQKITSVSASLASSKFSLKEGMEVTFDSRVFIVPPLEVNNYFVWRQQDAVRNSIQAVAQSAFSSKELRGLNNSQLQELLWFDKQINWSKLPTVYKRGFCIIKKNGEWIADKKIPEFSKNRKYVNRFVPELRLK
jgi:tRNA(His) 5'-end guanylyltransferase